MKDAHWATSDTRIRGAGMLQQMVEGIRESNRLAGHSDSVRSVAFSPDGQTLASGSVDNTVKLWLDEEATRTAGCNWVRDYLRNNANVEDEDRQLCQVEASASVRVVKGERLAKAGDWEAATVEFQKARELDAEIDLNPETEAIDPNPETVARYWAALGKVGEGWDLARQGEIEKAISAYTQAQQFNSEIDLNPETEAIDPNPETVARYWAAPVKVGEGQDLAQQGEIEKAISAYTQAQQFDPTLEISAQSWNALCWDGSLSGFATEVMDACEKAVTPDPTNGGIRDSRGLARALTGDTKGAIEDFQAFVAWTDSKESKAQRQQWIDALRRGENPFTEDVLQELRDE